MKKSTKFAAKFSKNVFFQFAAKPWSKVLFPKKGEKNFSSGNKTLDQRFGAN